MTSTVLLPVVGGGGEVDAGGWSKWPFMKGDEDEGGDEDMNDDDVGPLRPAMEPEAQRRRDGEEKGRNGMKLYNRGYRRS